MIHDVIDKTLRGVESAAKQMRQINRAAESLFESNRLKRDIGRNWRSIQKLRRQVDNALDWEPPTVKIAKTENYDIDGAPKYETEGAAAFDLRTNFDRRCRQHKFDKYQHFDKDQLSYYGPVLKIPTGLKFQIPKGYHGRVSLRSSVGETGLVIPHGIGVIDSDYRGQVYILLASVYPQKIEFEHGQRIAQMSIVPSPQCELEFVDSLDETARGDGGFGSTGEK